MSFTYLTRRGKAEYNKRLQLDGKSLFQVQVVICV